MGRVGSGKTTLTQALKGENIHYKKTQYVYYGDTLIDTPGEYIQSREFGAALALYSYEADVVGLLLSATEQYSLFSPNITCLANREVIGIITKADHPEARPDLAEMWLRLAGCEKVFTVSSVSGEGIQDLIDYLSENNQKNAKK